MDKKDILHAIVLLSAVFFRITLIVLNKDSYQNPAETAELILDKGILPLYNECGSCQTPKLFSVFLAEIHFLAGIDRIHLTTAAQLTNATLSIAVLILLYKLLKVMQISNTASLLVFSLAAFNPGLLKAGIQPANDMPVVAFSCIAAYSIFMYLRSNDRAYFFWMVLSTILAGLSKMNGLPMVLAVLLGLSFFGISKRTASAAAAFLILYLLFVPLLGQYIQNIGVYGTMFRYDMDQQYPSIRMFEETYSDKPGVRSIMEGYLSFRLGDILRQPYVNDRLQGHGTLGHIHSVWSLIYGKALFLPFGEGPFNFTFIGRESEGWLLIGRMALALGLFFFAALLAGAFSMVQRLIYGSNNASDIALMMPIPVYLAFMIQFSIIYRGYDYIKEIYIYAMFLPVFVLVAKGMDSFSNRYLREAGVVICIFLILVHIADSMFLILHLLS
jgi:hypothetical protein